MSFKVLAFDHCGVRTGPSPTNVAEALRFYRQGLGLEIDAYRPNFKVAGHWMMVGGITRIHLIAGENKVGNAGKPDPTMPHTALLVDNIGNAATHFETMGMQFERIPGPAGERIYLYDPAGNLIELGPGT